MKSSPALSARYPGAQRPPEKTLADYLAIGVGPVLIMFLVGSLIFFLVEIGYRGTFSLQIRWILFWFTVASVLVSRISIEQGSHLGAIYGLALGAATGLRLCAFLGAPLGALLLLAVIWWCGSKLTWDCTLIDETADASGQGLLQFAGFESPEPPPGTAPPSGPSTQAPAVRAKSAAAERPHAPGLWLIYFSIAVIPVLGIGQWTIPLSDPGARLRAFILAVIFVSSALALLLTTSFLGLRRYLRQRHLVMPTPMARSWMTLGATMLVIVLAGALFLPRPHGPDTLARFATGLRDLPQTASRFAWLRGEAAPGEGREIGTGKEASANPAPGGRNPSRGSPGASPGGSQNRGQSPANGSGTETGRRSETGNAGGNRSESNPNGGRSGESSPSDGGTPPPPSVPEIPPEITSNLRWLSWLIGFSIAAYLLLRFGRQWWNALRAFWPAHRRAPRAAPAPKPRRTPAFTDFANPFRTGRASSLSPEGLLAYTFDALQAWAADAGRPRSVEQTPIEFGRRLAESAPDIGEEILATIRLYVSTAYGGIRPSPESVEVLRRLWSALGA